jgi:5-methylcytosine-specific restriction endonuclease McrA
VVARKIKNILYVEKVRMISSLVLNRNYQPINVVSWKRAIKKVVNGRADIIYAEEGRYQNFDFEQWVIFSQERMRTGKGISDKIINIRGVNVFIPPVIRTLFYDEIKGTAVRLTRKNLYLRDNHTCAYCGKKLKSIELNIDHIIPRSKGGKHVWENVVCSCYKCNTKKDDMLLEECGMKLLKKPYTPIHNLFTEKKSGRIEGSRTWGSFISDVYQFEGEINDY